MKKPIIKKKSKKDIESKLKAVPYNLLEQEIQRREQVEITKESDKNIKTLYKYYRSRAKCPLLGYAYLPRSRNVPDWKGLDTLRKVELASIRFGFKNNTKHSKFELTVCPPADNAIRGIIDDWDPKIRKFWNDTEKNFIKLIQEATTDPARIAAMIAEGAHNFWMNSDRSTEVEVEYYNKIIALFNKAVIERFADYTDDVLVNTLEGLKTNKIRVDTNQSETEDVLMAVLRKRGHEYELNEERWNREEAEEDDIEEIEETWDGW